MNSDKIIEFINACIQYLDSLDYSEIEKLKHIYLEEMKSECKETYFEVFLPV